MMIQGEVSAAAPARVRHAPLGEYDAFLRRHYDHPDTRRSHRLFYAHFVQAYPDLQAWFAAPLLERVGHLHGTEPREYVNQASYQARVYLTFLALRGYATFDWEWLIALPSVHLAPLLAEAGRAAEVEDILADAIRLGYTPRSAVRMCWILHRFFLHTSFLPVAALTEAHERELADAIRRVEGRVDLALFFGSTARYRKLKAMTLAAAHMLHVVLYHRGQVATEPRVIMPSYADRPTLRPRMEAVAARYLAARRMTSRPGTVAVLDLVLRRFIAWIAEAYPDIVSFAAVTRDHVLEYAQYLDGVVGVRTGRPLALLTKRNRLAGLSHLFHDIVAWGWDDTPRHPLLGPGDLPRIPHRVPRYIPEDELARLMAAVRALPCPYQRAALLIARWSGARRGEIQRLSLECLDRYPDGTARLRIPPGKTYCERLVPLHEEAADAIRALQSLHTGQRGFHDPQTGAIIRYLFMHGGKRYSVNYLFDRSLQLACAAAGLIDGEGRPTISAHRLRHTVGTQLAEKGAKLHTIMKVLGHTSASMSLVYAQISDREVLKDYQAVLGPGAALAGPAAASLRSGELAPTAVDWLQANFFKTELELGHCLRLPQEGPCECDLYLACAKFVTTPEYAPRLRQRRQRELALVEDAIAHSWMREVERHRCTVGRIEQLLTELGEPIDVPDAQG